MKGRTGSIRLAGTALAAAALTLLLAVPTAEAVTGGPTIPVNTTIPNYQNNPTIAASPNGDFMIAWQGSGQDGYGVYARSFDASGAPLSDEITVNTTPVGGLVGPAIADDGDGGFTIAWQGSGQGGSRSDIDARRFDAAGSPLGDQITVNTTTTGEQRSPAIAADGSGGFTVAWESCTHPLDTFNGCSQEDGAGWNIFAQRFDVSGNPQGGEIAVNAITEGDQCCADIAAEEDGDFTVLWQSEQPDGSSPTVVYARRFEASGAPLREEKAVSGTGGAGVVAIAADGGGGIDVAWGTNFTAGVKARRFDASGAPLGDVVQVDPTQESAGFPDISADPDGGFTVVWAGVPSGPPYTSHVYARRFDASGTALTSAVRVDPTTEASREQATVAADGSGGFLVAWSRHEPIPTGDDVFARHFVSVPETQIDSGPSGPANDATPTFSFSSDETGSTFECKLDDAEFSPCSSPLTLGPLADGRHSFEVRATNAADETDQTPATSSFTLDTIVPNAQIDSGPSGLTDESSPTFAFSSDDPNSTLECKLDFAAFSGCTSPLTVGPLTEGHHIFSVLARDDAGNVDPTPAVREFTLDTVPPIISIILGPEDGSKINDPTPTFHFDANKSASFECKLDDEPTEACGSPFTTDLLADGPHLFTVLGTDEFGFTGSASREFTLDTTAPDTAIDSGPSGPTADSTPTFAFSSNEPGSTFECRLDGSPFSACSSPFTTRPLRETPHSFAVQATDPTGNTDPTPAIREFSVQANPIELAPVLDRAGPTISLKIRRQHRAATLIFSASDPSASSLPIVFTCRLDRRKRQRCSSPKTYKHLRAGMHRVRVIGTDAAGNLSRPATARFKIGASGPAR